MIRCQSGRVEKRFYGWGFLFFFFFVWGRFFDRINLGLSDDEIKCRRIIDPDKDSRPSLSYVDRNDSIDYRNRTRSFTTFTIFYTRKEWDSVFPQPFSCEKRRCKFLLIFHSLFLSFEWTSGTSVRKRKANILFNSHTLLKVSETLPHRQICIVYELLHSGVE